MSDFTPGPWKVNFFDAKITSESGVVAIINSCNSTGSYNENVDANMKLIAAAPEMYEVMQEFCNRVETGEVRSKATYEKFKAILNKIKQ